MHTMLATDASAVQGSQNWTRSGRSVLQAAPHSDHRIRFAAERRDGRVCSDLAQRMRKVLLVPDVVQLMLRGAVSLGPAVQRNASQLRLLGK